MIALLALYGGLARTRLRDAARDATDKFAGRTGRGPRGAERRPSLIWTICLTERLG